MTIIIAEAGVNHNGSEELALKLVDAAYESGANIVKFQTFKAKNLATEQARQADYQIENTQKQESQLSMLSRLELSYDFHFELLNYCKKLGIEFLSTAFDSESLSFLVNNLGLKRLKISSGEITNAPFLLEHARTGCDLIISTGMCTLADIENALGVIAFGYIMDKDVKATTEGFRAAYFSERGQQILKSKVTILHCTSEYPAPIAEINLKAIDTLSGSFGLQVGYSDHSEGITIPIAAVARGAVLIEKHFTLDKTLEGPDHLASLEPSELKEMVKAIKDVEKAIGSGVKLPTPSEIKNIQIGRKSIVAATTINKGEKLTANNLTFKRPGTGMSPYNYWDLLGKEAQKNYREGDLIDE